jgi:hypothetical protein
MVQAACLVTDHDVADTVEQVIANFKAWRIMHTDYRRPLGTFPKLSQPWSSCTSTQQPE